MDKEHDYNKLLTKEFEFFDKIRFDKNKNESEDYTYTLSNGNIITESGGLDSGEHIVQIVFNNSLYTIGKVFHSNGNIKSKGPEFKGDLEIGIWYDFDDNGKLIKETNLDKPYKISVEDIQQFLVQNKASFDRFISVSRNYNPKTKVGTWNIQYDGLYKEKFGRYRIEIDDESTEIQQVIRVTGKHGEKEIVFKK